MKNAQKYLIRISISLLLCSFSSGVYAYIDPGTGSLLLQGLIAGIAAGAYTIKMYWYKIKSFFTPSKENSEELEEE